MEEIDWITWRVALSGTSPQISRICFANNPSVSLDTQLIIDTLCRLIELVLSDIIIFPMTHAFNCLQSYQLLVLFFLSSFFAGIPGFNQTASSLAFHSAEWIQAIIIQKSREMFQLKFFASLVLLLLLQIHDGKLEKLFREFFSGCNMEKVLILPKWLHYSALWICCERSELLSSGLCDSVTFSAVFIPQSLLLVVLCAASQEKCK